MDTDPDAAAEAMPTMETWPANIGKPAIEVPAVSGGNSPQEGRRVDVVFSVARRGFTR